MIRIALIHDWLTGVRGGEMVLEAIAELFPQAELYTLLCFPESYPPHIKNLKKHTSLLQKIPKIKNNYRFLLPIMPSFIEKFDLSGFDLILSSSHCVAKGIKKPPNALHISYIHAPMRYIWDCFEDYFGPGKSSFMTRLAAQSIRNFLKNWDKSTSAPKNIDHLVANSHFIAKKIKKHYDREATVIYPFTDPTRFNLPRQPGSEYLMVSAFAPYKKIDIAIEAFNHLQLPLIIIGSGQDEKRLKKQAGKTIRFLGRTSDETIARHYAECRALVFPGIEDFGITPIEALSAGAPVIAFEKGGVTETVTSDTGYFFSTQSTDSLVKAIQKMEADPFHFSEKACRERGASFSKKRFQKELLFFIQTAWKNFKGHEL